MIGIKRRDFENEREYMKAYKKIYNKEYSKDKQNEVFECECGGKYSYYAKHLHIKTKRHQEYEEFGNNTEYMELLNEYENEPRLRRKYNVLALQLKELRNKIRQERQNSV